MDPYKIFRLETANPYKIFRLGKISQRKNQTLSLDLGKAGNILYGLSPDQKQVGGTNGDSMGAAETVTARGRRKPCRLGGKQQSAWSKNVDCQTGRDVAKCGLSRGAV